jgi:hypothetical protein
MEDFLNRLDKLTYIKCEDNTLYTKEGFQINHSLKLDNSIIPDRSIIFTFRVWKGDIYINTWSCLSADDKKIAIDWWFKKCRAINYIDYEEKYADEIRAKKEFETLTKIN